MPARALTGKQLAIRERNRASAQKSTGPRTVAGKARSARNALTHGLTAESPRDEADVADRAQRAALLIETFQPADDFELALIHRMAAAFQRLERADHLESQALDSAFSLRPRTAGAVLANQTRMQTGFSAINRYRATAQTDLFNAYRMLEVYRSKRPDDVEAQLQNEP